VRLVDELAAEHELIERVAGGFRTYARRRAARQAPQEDGVRFVEFFRTYAGQFHHAREEDVLFVALRERAELPGDRGPIAAIVEDHRRMAELLDRLALLVTADDDHTTEVLDLALRYTEALWHHIDAETSVLFPESVLRLRRHGIAELDSRPPTTEEAAAGADGEALLASYPPTPENEVLRGDGCIACPSYERTCRGLEREWWNEWEWEEFEDHLPSG
jgi:hemerythrin-like domain-containing protein